MAAPDFRRIPLRHRFHVRISAIYAAAAFIGLFALAVMFYSVAVDSEMRGLKRELLSTAMALAAFTDADVVVSLSQGETDGAEEVLIERVAAIQAVHPEFQSIYALVPTGRPGIFRFAFDSTLDDDNASPGEEYDGSDLPYMLRGLDEPVVEPEPFRDEWGLFLSAYAPVRDASGASVGVVGVDLQAVRIDLMRRRIAVFTLSVLFGAGLLLVFVTMVVGRNVRRPLGAVMRASSSIAEGQFDANVAIDRPDEFGLLGENFNVMASGLKDREFIRATFGKYVSEGVAKQLLEDPGGAMLGGEEREVTVLLSDIRGYSTISENLAPGQVVTMLNAYLGSMNGVIDDNQGCVIEYLGDAIMAAFGAPNDVDNHQEWALKCAMAMRTRLVEMNEEWSRTGLAAFWRQHGVEQLTARIGLHSGNAIAGNLGSHLRMKYAVIGATVNLSARLEALNKELGTDILVSQAVYDNLSPELQAQGTDQGVHSVKGFEQPVQVYSF